MSYLQQLESEVHLRPAVIERNLITFSSAEELKKYLAFVYYYAKEADRIWRTEEFMIIPLGVFNNVEYHAKIEKDNIHNKKPWFLKFLGPTPNLSNEFASSPLLPHFPDIVEKYYMTAGKFAFFTSNYKNILSTIYGIEFECDPAVYVNPDFQECYRTGRIVYKNININGENILCCAFPLNCRDRNGNQLFALCTPNTNAGQQEWHCERISPLNEINGFDENDFLNFPPPPPPIKPHPEEPVNNKKVFLVYGNNPITHKPPEDLERLKYILKLLKVKYEILAGKDQGGVSVRQALDTRMNECSFAFVFYTSDDEINSDPPEWHPRMNVLFEAGMLYGKLGPEKVRILKHSNGKNLIMASDIEGTMYIDLEGGDWMNLVEQALQNGGILPKSKEVTT